MNPFHKHADLIVRAKKPFNAGPPPALLTGSYVTAIDHFFVRNHAPVPEIDADSFRLSVGGLMERRLELSLDDLRRNFPTKTVMATLQCAGNRREELSQIEAIADQVQWGAEAISNAEWRGAPLREVLLAGGIGPEAKHVAFTGLDEVKQKGGETFGYGGSIPLGKAMQPEVLLAYEMNGEPLPEVHGGPLRVVVPGYIGARSVKWVGDIGVQRAPSENHFQASAYKIFQPHIHANTVDWSKGLMLGELSVNSAISYPTQGEKLAPGPVAARGYAMAGGNRHVERVDVSVDDGRTWAAAELEGESLPGVWRLWHIELDLEPGEHQIIARAWDSAANTQPENARHIWNFKGYMNNAWHRVSVVVAD